MRLSRWLLAAGLGVGVLARTEDDSEQQDSLSHEFDSDGLIPFLPDPWDEDKPEDTCAECIPKHLTDWMWKCQDKCDFLGADGNIEQRDSDFDKDGVIDHILSIFPGHTDWFPDIDFHESPEPEDLVSNIPAYVTPGWKTSSKTHTHGHRWKWTYTVTATKPTEFILTYHDHHDHTTVQSGEYNPDQRPRVTMFATRNALDVMEEAIIDDIVADSGVAAREATQGHTQAVPITFGGLPEEPTPGLVFSGSMKVSGHRMTFTATAINPTSFVGTEKVAGTKASFDVKIDTEATPPVTVVTAVAKGHTITKTVTSGNDAIVTAPAAIKGSRLTARDSFNIFDALSAGSSPDLTSDPVFSGMYNERGSPAFFTITITETNPLAYTGVVKVGKQTNKVHGAVVTTVIPPLLVETSMDHGRTLTGTHTIPMDFGSASETAAPIAKRFYDALPARVTPGQTYTHTAVQKGVTTTATIKVTATKPHTGFAITMHNGTVTRTCMAYINKTATPPVIVQTVTGGGLSFVQTDTWSPEKAHAYLPHATPAASRSTHERSHAPTDAKSAASTSHASNGTKAAHRSTIVKTHIMTTTIQAVDTTTVVRTLPPEPCTTSEASLEDWTVTIHRQSCGGPFLLPSASPKAMLHSYNGVAAKLVEDLKMYQDDADMIMLLPLSMEDLKHDYHHLGWTYIETLARQMQRIRKDLDENMAAAVVIIWMQRQTGSSDSCPCDGRGRRLPGFIRPAVTTKYVARFGPDDSTTITPPTTIIRDDRTIPFRLASTEAHSTHRKHHHSHSHYSSDEIDLITAMGPMQTMVVVLDNHREVSHFPRNKKEHLSHHRCGKDSKFKGNKKECKIQECMWKFLEPINITTAMPAMMTDEYGHAFFDYFTHTTFISGRPHWGTSTNTGVYYPMSYNTTYSNGCQNKTAFREQPATSTSKKAFAQSVLSRARQSPVEGDPKCWNRKTCYNICSHPQKGFWHSKTFKVILAVLAGLFLLAVLIVLTCVLMACLARRRKKNKEKEERAGDPSMSGAVDQGTAESLDPRTVAAASALGPATAAAASGKNAGTLGRQAEEGRGRIQFADNAATAAGAGAAGAAAGESAAGGEKSGGGEKAGGAASGGAGGGSGGAMEAKGTVHTGGTAETSEKVADAPAEHVETVAAHDGADSRRTGSEMADMGSMRGRRPIRANDLGLI